MSKPNQELLGSVKCRTCNGKGYRTRVNPAWLRAARHHAQRSLREVARELGLSAAYLCDVELGRRELSADHRIVVKYRSLWNGRENK